MALTHYDPYGDGLDEGPPISRGGGGGGGGGGGIADRMYRRLHEEGASAAPPKPKTGAPKIARPPIALMCYLCGQQFGTASLGIHQKQCYTKKLLQWERGDPETRGPRPVLRTPEQQSIANETGINDSRSSNGAGYSAMSAKQMEQFNNMQFQEFQEQSLVPCENCGRTFFPDRLQVHLRSCKPGATARPVRRSVEPAAQQQSASSLDARPLPKRPATMPSPEASPANGGAYDGAEFADEFSAKRTKANSTDPLRSASAQQYGGSSVGDSESMDSRVAGGRRGSFGDFGDDSRSNDASPVLNERKGVPVIPNFNLCRGEAPTGDDSHDGLVRDPQAEEDESQSVSSDFLFDADDATNATLSPHVSPAQPKPRPKAVVARPLDLSHVQSRFKMASTSNLERCQYCNRTFAPDRLVKHEEVCIEKKRGGPIGMTPRVGGGKMNESIVRPPSSSGPARSGAATSRVVSSGYGAVSRDNGPLTTRGAAGGVSKIIRPANASSRAQSPSLGQPSRSPPPGLRGSSERGTSVKPLPPKIIQPAARHPSPSPGRAGSGDIVSPPPEEARPKFCTDCGTRLFAATQKFCGECGHRIGL